jgi:hypothetical protein
MTCMVRIEACDAQDALQRRLTELNRARLQPGLPSDAAWFEAATHPARLDEEWRFLEAARARVIARAAQAPTDPAGFLRWFEALAQDGPGQGDPVFPWLASNATMAQMRWFLAQEVAGEAGFDDLTALTLLRMPVRPKLELARNFWDEMGRGNARGMHGPMLEDLAHALRLHDDPPPPVWQALALANTMAGLAARRCTAYQSVGALGVVELTAPGRAAQVAAGLKRLGVPPRHRHYFDLHAVLDIKHSAAWNAEVIAPLAAQSPEIATAMAEGALMRLECGAACFARYRETFGLAR